MLEYQGTLLLVSHDRAFLNSVVTSTLVFEGEGKIGEYCGGYDDWVAKRSSPKIFTPKIDTAPTIAPVQKNPETVSLPVTFLKREQRELEELPPLIEQWEKEKESLSVQLCDPELYRGEAKKFSEIQAQLHALEEQIAKSYRRWEELEEKRNASQN